MTTETVWVSNSDSVPKDQLPRKRYRAFVEQRLDRCVGAVFSMESNVTQVEPDDIFLFGQSDLVDQFYYDLAYRVAAVVDRDELVRLIAPNVDWERSVVVLLSEQVDLHLDAADLEQYSVSQVRDRNEPDSQARGMSDGRQNRSTPSTDILENSSLPPTDSSELLEDPATTRSQSRATFADPGTLTPLRTIDSTVRSSIEDEWQSFWEFIQTQGFIGDAVRTPRNEIRLLNSLTIIKGPCHLGKARYVRAHARQSDRGPLRVEEVFLDSDYTYDSLVERVDFDGTISDGILKRLNRKAENTGTTIVLLLHDLHTVTDPVKLFGSTLHHGRELRRVSGRPDIDSMFRHEVTPRLRHSHDQFQWSRNLKVVGLFDTVDRHGNTHDLPVPLRRYAQVETFKPDIDLLYLANGVKDGDEKSAIHEANEEIWSTYAVDRINQWLETEGVDSRYRLGHEPLLSVPYFQAWTESYLPLLEEIIEIHEIEEFTPLLGSPLYDPDDGVVTNGDEHDQISIHRAIDLHLHAITDVCPTGFEKVLEQ